MRLLVDEAAILGRKLVDVSTAQVGLPRRTHPPRFLVVSHVQSREAEFAAQGGGVIGDRRTECAAGVEMANALGLLVELGE